MEPGVGGDCKAFDAAPSSRSSTFINLPCLELGGGGFFLGAADGSGIRPLLSSSGSDISCDVRGDSGNGSCTASKIDCRDIDDVSVLLPPSPRLCATCVCAPGWAADVLSPALPVINNLLNASTSIDALPAVVVLVGCDSGASRSGCSIVSSVFENGFAGALLGLLVPSSSEVSDVTLSKGSSAREIGGEGGLPGVV